MGGWLPAVSASPDQAVTGCPVSSLCSTRTPGGDSVLCTPFCACSDRCPASECHTSDSRGKALLEVPPWPAASKPSNPICSTPRSPESHWAPTSPSIRTTPSLALPSSCLSPFCLDLFFFFLKWIPHCNVLATSTEVRWSCFSEMVLHREMKLSTWQLILLPVFLLESQDLSASPHLAPCSGQLLS